MCGGAVAALCVGTAWASPTRVPLDGTFPDGGPDYQLVPFEVPAGTAEITVQHDDGSAVNVLDWGLLAPDGFRGWGGGNAEDAVVGEQAASRSYLAGPLTPGTWHVLVGRARVRETPATYALDVFLRETPTLAPEDDRAPYVPVPALRQGPDWYAGDFHVHSTESGDAFVSPEDAIAYARSRGLDVVELSEHNTTSQLERYAALQAAFPDILLLPGIEITTYRGHANAIGATAPVDFWVGLDGLGIGDVVDLVHAQGALFALNHPALDFGNACIGCAWTHEGVDGRIDALEVITGGADGVSALTVPPTLALWESLLEQGHHIAAIGGSDDHRGGAPAEAGLDGRTGSPTTLVHADRLDVASVLDGVRRGRTVVKLGGPDDPFVELWPEDRGALDGDTVHADRVTWVATTRDAVDHELWWFVDGEVEARVPVAGAGFEDTLEVAAPVEGERRVRVELRRRDVARVITSHVWVRAPRDTGTLVDTAAPVPVDGEAQGCGCRTGRPIGWVWGLPWLVLLRRRRSWDGLGWRSSTSRPT